MAKQEHALIVLARENHGDDFRELYHEAHTRMDKNGDVVKYASANEAKEKCIAFIRQHRAGATGREYRIKDMVTGKLLD